MQKKLLYVQTSKIPGMPFDPWTYGEKWISTWGRYCLTRHGKGSHHAIERFIVWQKLLAGLEIQKMAEAIKVAKEEGIDPNAILGAMGHGGGKGKGRPPSNQQAPRVASKDGGERSTIATSK